MGYMRNAYLLETQEVVCLGVIPRNNVGLTELLGEGSTFPQRPVLNGSREEGRRVDLLPQVKTRMGRYTDANDGWRRTSNGSSCSERSRGPT